MKCFSKIKTGYGFTLPEVMASLAILAIIATSVFIVINRCMASAADSDIKMKAFQVARENMETLLASKEVGEKVEFGESDRFPEIKWKTAVETFYEPITTRMWVQAVCSADYVDSDGQDQTIALTDWLTGLSVEQLLEIKKAKQIAKEMEENGELDPNNPVIEPNEPVIEPNKPVIEPNKPVIKPKPEPPWPDWLPPKDVWDKMTRAEKLAYLLSTI